MNNNSNALSLPQIRSGNWGFVTILIVRWKLFFYLLFIEIEKTRLYQFVSVYCYRERLTSKKYSTFTYGNNLYLILYVREIWYAILFLLVQFLDIKDCSSIITNVLRQLKNM